MLNCLLSNTLLSDLLKKFNRVKFGWSLYFCLILYRLSLSACPGPGDGFYATYVWLSDFFSIPTLFEPIFHSGNRFWTLKSMSTLALFC